MLEIIVAWTFGKHELWNQNIILDDNEVREKILHNGCSLLMIAQYWFGFLIGRHYIRHSKKSLGRFLGLVDFYDQTHRQIARGLGCCLKILT